VHNNIYPGNDLFGDLLDGVLGSSSEWLESHQQAITLLLSRYMSHTHSSQRPVSPVQETPSTVDDMVDTTS